MTERVVIVTGAAHGIGLAYARRLCADGASVVLADLDEEAAKEQAARIGREGGTAVGYGVDISDEPGVDALADYTAERFGRITGLVNNAAVFSVVPMSRSPYDLIDVEEWDLMMRVNVRGTWQMSRAAARHMRREGYGKIVNISSGTALKGAAGRIHYVTSKAAILGFTKTLARELGPHNITVNCVAPGSTLSEEDPDPAVVARRAEGSRDRALARTQTPADLVGAVAFFLSPDSDFITGQTLVVDGGSFLH
ncbi:SDR family NAD(P)-dependent oxidoreductase [Phytohabitans kaempferiae]|uniref:SDR family NAD(P)-dependent oxidoreductase n=1 Tax=Phytohabitans kaempferiae TaxID=1620943 RepID=A0ABV6LYL1_9ACTN